jgi:uncharacterized protein (DUF934 family)
VYNNSIVDQRGDAKMQQQVGVNIQQYLDALHEIEKQGKMRSASLLLHPSGDGAVMLENLPSHKMVAVDFDDGDDILEAIRRLAEKAADIL